MAHSLGVGFAGWLVLLPRQFAEKEGFAHVHFHVVPRPVALVPALRGPGIFALLDRAPVPDAERDAVSAALSDLLN